MHPTDYFSPDALWARIIDSADKFVVLALLCSMAYLAINLTR